MSHIEPDSTPPNDNLVSHFNAPHNGNQVEQEQQQYFSSTTTTTTTTTQQSSATHGDHSAAQAGQAHPSASAANNLIGTIPSTFAPSEASSGSSSPSRKRAVSFAAELEQFPNSFENKSIEIPQETPIAAPAQASLHSSQNRARSRSPSRMAGSKGRHHKGKVTEEELADIDPFYRSKIEESKAQDKRSGKDTSSKRASVFDSFLSGRLSTQLSPEEEEFQKQWNLDNGIESDTDSESDYSYDGDDHSHDYQTVTTTTTTNDVKAPGQAYHPNSATPYQAGMVDPEASRRGSYSSTTTTTKKHTRRGSHHKRKNEKESKGKQFLKKIPGFNRPPKEIPTQRRISVLDLKHKVHSGNKRGLGTSAILLSFVAAMSGFSFGYDTGIISGVLVVIGQSLTHPFDLSVSQRQWITSSAILTALIAALFAGPISDKIGRKIVLLLSCVFYIIGSAVMATAPSYNQFIWGRIILGFGIGASSLVAPLYISELAPALHRGKMIVLNVFMITLGQLVAYTMGAAMNDTRSGWKYMVAIGGLPACIQIIFLLFMPESPRYLLFKGKVIQARKVLKNLCPGLLEEEVVARLKMMNSDRLSVLQSLGELFAKPAHTRALVIGCGLQAIQQLSGFNALMYYSGTLLRALGYRNPMAAGMVVAGTNCLFTIIAFFIIDRVSRRRLLLWTILGMLLGHFWIAISYNFMPRFWYNFVDRYHMNAWNSIMLVGMIIFVAFYALGIGNLPWHQGEMFPTSVRGVGTSITTGVNWLLNFVISFTFLTMFERIGPVWTFGFFCLLCVSSEIFAYFVYPELSGLGIEEIDCLLTSGFGVKESQIIREDRKLFGLIEGEAI